MEKIQISKEQELNLITDLKKRVSLGMIFIIIGLIGIIPIGITLFNDADTSYYSSGTFAFTIIGIILIGQSDAAAKGIKKGDYQAYKTECKKVGWEFASVKNNDVLSKKVTKEIKKVAILGSTKAIKAGDEIGIIQAGKEFWAFPLSE